MESQILYESLTKPRCDLDKNMNRTNEKTAGNLNVTVNTEISTVGSISGSAKDEAQSFVPSIVQPKENGPAEFKTGQKSKLLEQLQSPPAVVPDNEDSIIEQNAADDAKSKELSKKSEMPLSKDGTNSAKTDDSDNKQTEVTSTQSFVSVQNSNISVLTDETKAETPSLASPAPSVSSARSMSNSPQPSPGNSATSPHEVSSSKSCPVGKKLHKRRRRGSAWTDAETEYLMEVWAKQADIIQQKGGDESVTCAPVYRLISRSMADQGWDKTWEQCKTRIHTLKRAYKITKDEIAEGCQTITYCRHFDKLEIICGDNPQVSPGMLSCTLEHKRKLRELEGKNKNVKQPVRRKLTVGENPNLAKKSNVGNNLLNAVGFTQFQSQTPISSAASAVSVQSTPSTNMIWYPPLPTQQQHLQLQQQQQQQQQTQFQQQQTQFQLQQQEAQACTLNQTQPSVQQPLPASALPPAPQYMYNATPASGSDVTLPSHYNGTEVNNNKINVKSEKSDIAKFNDVENSVGKHDQPETHWNVLSAQPSNSKKSVTAAQKSSGNELERLRLDLEMRKLEVERNKIEMEERQRREDRDHQYRMMQLLLFGLGQQNISQVMSGQGSDVTHAHDAVLSRALENGLVPGGSQKVNEKGLSFSEL